MASDSRSNAGFDQVNVCRKMYRFVTEGERVFVILTSGSLSISQSIMSLLRSDFDDGHGLAQASSVYQAARIVGDMVRRVSEIDRASLERDSRPADRPDAVQARQPEDHALPPAWRVGSGPESHTRIVGAVAAPRRR